MERERGSLVVWGPLWTKGVLEQYADAYGERVCGRVWRKRRYSSMRTHVGKRRQGCRRSALVQRSRGLVSSKQTRGVV
jgi:hypothetical protein